MTDLPFLPPEDRSRHLWEQDKRNGGWKYICDFDKVTTSILEVRGKIPTDLTHLLIRYVWSSTRAGFTDTGFRFRWNNIAANYDFAYNSNCSPAVASGVSAAATSAYVGQVPAGNKPNVNYVGKGEILLPSYRGAYLRTWQSKSGWHAGGSLGQMDVYGSGISGVADITWLQLFDDVAAAYDGYTQAQLYGAR